MNVLHLHEAVQIYGGAEVYISQLQDLLPRFNINSYWIGIYAEEDNWIFETYRKAKQCFKSKKEVKKALAQFVTEHSIDIINIHALFERDIIEFCLSVKPVIKYSHSPLMVCPGRDKFWRYSERPCDIKYGLHCFYHIYSEGCSNRHPKRIIKAWRSVEFEIKIASRLYKKIIVMSDYIKHGLLECGVAEDKVLVNPYFTDYIDDPINNRSQEKRILFIGRIISSKGPHILISALKDILSINPDVYLDIVGDGPMLGELKTQAEKQGINDKVIFHGWKHREEIKQILRSSYLLAFPSIYPEAFGITGIEAMMNAKPVVGFDVGGVSTWLKNGETGFLIPRGDIEQFKQKIELLLNDSSLYQFLSEQSRMAAIKNYVPEVHMNKLVHLYNEILSDQKKLVVK
jgi:glycosyltransferase involved in cell wall biosynthesis